MTSFESEATRIIDKFNGGNTNLWKFKIKILLASRSLRHYMRIRESHTFQCGSKILKKIHVHHQPQLGKQPTYASRVARDPHGHGRPSATFTRRRICPTSCSFANSSSPDKCKRVTTHWTTSTRSRHS